MNSKLVLVEFHNCSPVIYRILSETEITLERVWDYFVEKENIHEEKDSITFIDEITTISIDTFEKSWNHIMPMVQKILHYCVENDCMEEYYSVLDAVPDLDHTYREVTEFIHKHLI